MRLPNEVELFIASPGDVQAERKLVKDVAERSVRICGVSLGVRIRVTGWEDVSPELGRPQGLINPLVDKCDVFVGLLNRRLGSDTGLVESGFVEEFERAIRRRADGGSKPAIALFFRRISTEDQEDAGPQLTRVLNFRDRIRDEHVALYREYESLEDLDRQLTDYVVGYISQLGGSVSGANEESSPGSPVNAPTLAETPQPADSPEVTEAGRQLIDMLASYQESVRRLEPRAGLDADRLVLFALAVRQEGLLPTHVANRLYRRRNTLRLVLGEALQWLRAIAVDMATDIDAEMLIPGWSVVGIGTFDDHLESLLDDPDDTVVLGALNMTRRLRTRPTFLWPEPNASIDSVRKASAVWHSLISQLGFNGGPIKYMASVAEPHDEMLIQTIQDIEPEHLWAGETKAIAEALRGKFEDMVGLAAENTGASLNWIKGFLITRISSLDDESLARLVVRTKGDSAVELQLMSFLELAKRKAVSTDVLLIAISSSDTRLQKQAVEFLAAFEDPKPLAIELQSLLAERKLDTEVRPRLLAFTGDPDELRAAANTPLGETEWEAFLLRNGAQQVDDARAFLRVPPEQWIASQTSASPGLEGKEKLFKYLYGERARSAIDALARLDVQGRDPGDEELVRAELRRGDLASRASAALALAAFHVPTDASLILAAATKTLPPQRAAIIQAAVEVGGAAFARTILNEPDTQTAVAAARFLVADANTEVSELEHLLLHQSARIRMVALDGLIRRLSTDEILDLMEKYQHREHYYYDVVAGLDRTLFAPPGMARLERQQT